jgi:Membrane bound FAD containing D-sorbitol dehydrogenase
MVTPFSRRDLLLRSAAAAIAAAGAGGFPTTLYAAAAVTLDQFLLLSKDLTEAGDLDSDMANKLLGGFLATGHGEGLAKLFAGQAEPELANAIVAAWYSGVYDSGQGPAVAGFDQALLWQAMNFTKPFADCGGETGYWSEPPRS